MRSVSRKLSAMWGCLQPNEVVVAKGSDEPERFSILVSTSERTDHPSRMWSESDQMDEARVTKRLGQSRFSQGEILRLLELARDRFSAQRSAQ